MPDPAIDIDSDSGCDSAPGPAAALDALTPEVARDIDGLLRSHAAAAPSGQLAFGGPGALIAAPLIRLILARLLPVVEAQALGLLDAEVAKLRGQYPTLDLSFVHGLVADVFAAVGGSFPAPGLVPAP